MTDNCVIDASVGIILFLDENDSDLADVLFMRLANETPATFYVPDLFYVECCNILWKYVRHYGYPAANARQDVAALQALRLQTVSTAELLTPALELALTQDLTAYDASYVALAKQLKLPLVTADRALVRKCAGTDITVFHLRDI